MSAPGGERLVEISHLLTELLPPETIAGCEATLSADERERHRRFYFADDRRDYAAAHDLLRRSLSRHGSTPPEAWTFAADAMGKPFLTGLRRDDSDSSQPPSSLSFNLSHTRGLVACAVTWETEVGVDVERVDRQIEIDGLARRYFSDMEVAALGRRRDATARAVHFFELWTLKEAFLKAIGTGLSQPLATASFDFRPVPHAGNFDHAETIVFSAPAGIDARAWVFALYAPSPRFRLAVAVHRGADSAGSTGINIRFCAGPPLSQPGASLMPLRATDGSA